MQKITLLLSAKIFIPFIFLIILINGCSGKKPSSIGQFINCPDKPNCISSKNSSNLNISLPLKYQGNMSKAKNSLLKVLKSMPRAKISTDSNTV